MARYPSESVARFDQQFAETPAERIGRLRERRDKHLIDTLRKLIADLSVNLQPGGHQYSVADLDAMRRRVANALPPAYLPVELARYRDPPVVKS